ncbi:hypothetical protein [Pasteurella canis]|uniref:hypothetical protein n=1 Tax=Pasteurella canis TaxID=753 RepID=UPI001CBE1208|nr:hypothetical protein [Pasteurella canis]UAX42965.1 hypothetical protein K7G89_000820 [Pasteurella canis]
MRQYCTRAVLFSSVLALFACSHLPETSTRDVSVVSAQAATQALGIDLASLEQKATTLRTFEYIYNNERYLAYLSTHPEFIRVQKDSNVSKFFYQTGKLAVVQDATGIYQFDHVGKLTKAVNIKGQKIDVSSEKQSELLTQGKKLLKILGNNKADASASRINTGSDAKVNYLCIAKIQQVAQTNRVFRSPENAVVTATNIKATVRLNGTQYYTMECQLANDKVSKLSLIKK